MNVSLLIVNHWTNINQLLIHSMIWVMDRLLNLKLVLMLGNFFKKFSKKLKKTVIFFKFLNFSNIIHLKTLFFEIKIEIELDILGWKNIIVKLVILLAINGVCWFRFLIFLWFFFFLLLLTTLIFFLLWKYSSSRRTSLS